MSDIKPYELFHSPMERTLQFFPDNHFHAIVVDPPYGIRFMGKAWDDFEIKAKGAQRDSYQVGDLRKASGRTTTGFGNSIEAGKYDTSLTANQQFQAWFTERCLPLYRVLRPGGHFICFGSTRTHHRMFSAIEDAGFEIRDTLAWCFGSGFPKSKNNPDRSLGSALKPAFEPICLARKPLDGTLEENFKKWGTGYLNIDACRIPLNGGYKSKPNGRPSMTGLDDNYQAVAANKADTVGRWPANILLDGSDEVVAVFPESDGQQGYVGPEHGDRPSINAYGDYGPRPAAEPRLDSGSAARFFYQAKCSREDRNEGCEHLINKPMLWSSGTENPGSFQSPGTEKSSPNNWPTVKPTNVMRYLIRLVTPKTEGAIILDPMMGSGSTGKAAIYEFVNFVGIDQEADAMPIAEARLRHALRNRGSMNIF